MMENWDEVRTAFQVARLGTVSGAAEVLGVHHATVIRHVDALEGRLGVKLFQRHARGYTPTEAGEDLMRVAQATDDQFNQLSGRIKWRGNGVSGELVVTSLVAVSNLLVPTLVAFQQAHPEVSLRYLTGDRLFRLEYGEAHVAIRAGRPPDQPDNVVQPFGQHDSALCATRAYAERNGLPQGEDDFAGHKFVCHDNETTRAPFWAWLRARVRAEDIVFRAEDSRALNQAILAGAGIGFLPISVSRDNPDVIEVLPPRDEWASPMWLVTHVDLHRTAKVQALLKHLKLAARAWEAG
jgi:DNA-binding transcriptional LysR family regulator